jgi:hypothetical protein
MFAQQPVDRLADRRFRSGRLRGLGGQKSDREQRAGDSSGDYATDAEPVIEGADGGLVDGAGRGALAVSGELARGTERCSDCPAAWRSAPAPCSAGSPNTARPGGLNLKPRAGTALSGPSRTACPARPAWPASWDTPIPGQSAGRCAAGTTGQRPEPGALIALANG